MNDSKAFEHMGGKIANIFRRFKQEYKNMDLEEILADYNIYHTPNYVYLKLRKKLGIAGEYIYTIKGKGYKIGGDI